jgi:urease accessory protein
MQDRISGSQVKGDIHVKTALRWALAAIATLAAPAAAFAHTGVGETHGFLHGFTHPLGGFDHILAMVAVGVFAAYLSGRALWLVPSAFVAMMGFGGWLGAEGIAIPHVEAGIAASIVVLGLAVAARLTLPAAVASALVGVFAIFHGHAHGAEMAMGEAGLSYAAGFMIATAALHGAGIGLGIGAAKLGGRAQVALRAGGGGMAALGLALLAGVI